MPKKTPSNEAVILGETETDTFENWVHVEDTGLWSLLVEQSTLRCCRTTGLVPDVLPHLLPT